MSIDTPISRRRFLHTAGGIALGSACGMATLGRLQMVQAATRADDYRALVCVFLAGGNDSFNMVVPRSGSAYTNYAAARPNLTIADTALLPIAPQQGAGGVSWGLHPGMTELQGLFESGKAALLANVGPLVAPTTKDDYTNRRVPLPPELFSHVDQQYYAMSLGSEVEARSGWGGKIADRLAASNDALGLPPTISLNGSNPWQLGASGGIYTLTSNGATQLDSSLRSSTNSRYVTRRAAFNRLMEAAGRDGSAFVREYARSTRRAADFADAVTAAINTVTLNTAFPTSTLAQSLRTAARVIGARQLLGQARQVFYVSLGGWDTHDNMLTDHQTLLTTLSQGLAAFYQATVELGIAEQVTAFTMTDFGRTLNNNGDGTDHGWGGHSWVVGGDVVGRRFYGQMPEYRLGAALDVGRGRMIPTTGIDQLGSTLARWYGLGYGDAVEIFPNLRNFGTGNDYLPMLASSNARLTDIQPGNRRIGGGK